MRFINFAAVSVILAVASIAPGEEMNFDHERLTTTDGRVYLDILVIGSDSSGLTFRHRVGIAKVDFARLSEAYRMLYEGLEAIDEAGKAGPETNQAEAVVVGRAGDLAQLAIGDLGTAPLSFSARNRVVVRLPSSCRWTGGGVDHTMRGPVWPSWWPRHEEVHRLTQPLCRELAVRDFLYSSGLLWWPGIR